MNGIKSFFVLTIVGIFLFVAFWVSTCFFEPKAYDFMMKMFTATKHGSDNIVLVVIDDDSIAKYRWPWKREMYANIFEYLNTYATPKVIMHDAIVSTLDKDNPESDKKYFSSISKMSNFISGMDFSFKEYDSAEYGRAVDENYYEKYSVPFKDNREYLEGFNFKSIIPFPIEYYHSLQYSAPVTCPQDFDGIARDISLFVAYKKYLYPYLGLRGFMYANNENSCIVSNEIIECKETGLKANQYNRFIGAHKRVPIKFYRMYSNNYSHNTISAVKILDDYDLIKQGKAPRLSPDLFKGKYVILGANVKATATGLSDIMPSAVSSRHPGTDILATVLDNCINNEFMKSFTIWQNFFVSIFVAFTIYLLIRTRNIFESLAISTIVLFLYFIIATLCFTFGIAINVITPVIISIVTMIFGYLHRFLIEGQNKEKIKKAMGKYISDDIMERVVKNIDELKLGGKRSVVTVLFADIRGFTSMSEQMSAEEVSNILNEYFTEIEPIITKHNGIINKFIGDAVMAIFGEPIMDKNHAINAVKCANDMLKKVRKLQHKWMEQGKPKIEIGIGINTGEVFVGNIGSERRMEYTVIGDTVNLASRIESYNKIYRTNFLIGPSTYSEVKNYVNVIKISDVQIRGKIQKLDLYEVLNVINTTEDDSD